MPGFKSIYDFARFAESVIRRGRYVFEPQADEFLSAVHITIRDRIAVLDAEEVYFRAQLGCRWRTTRIDPEQSDSETIQLSEPFEVERMKPLLESAREGRINAKGIPCLYLSNDKTTAMAETRPWLGSFVSLGEFRIMRQLRLVNCCEPRHLFEYLLLADMEPSPESLEAVAWGEISHSFSTPVTPSDTSAEYAPTQILSDLFRRHGYDGILYQSLLGPGYNFALFDLNCASLRSCCLYELKNLQFDFNECVREGYVCGEDGSQPQ